MDALTTEQQEAVDAWVKYGSKAEAARRLGVNTQTMFSRIAAAQVKGWELPIAPVDVPEGMKATKTTVQYNAEGKVIQEWRRMQQERVFSDDFVKSLVSQVKGKGKVPKAKKVKSDICFELCAYDLHFGMYASADETGDGNYDCNIASKRFLEAVHYLSSKTNKPAVARLILGGDQLHADDNNARTPQSGHVLDVDTRHQLVIRKLVTACREAVSHLCTIAPKVEIYTVAGNHDPQSSLWLSQVLEAYYDKCKNVEVCTQMTPRKYAVWGDCLSVYAHGDKPKADRFPSVVAAERPDLWGQTKYRYARLGHIHTKKVIAPIVVDEKAGMEVTNLSSLASADAWHAHSGYIGNQRGMQAFELDKNRGQDAQYYYNL
jgi:hypothetical protein